MPGGESRARKWHRNLNYQIFIFDIFKIVMVNIQIRMNMKMDVVNIQIHY
jgi:hypothetical protein